MDEQFKSRLLSYLVGDLKIESGNNDLHYSQYENFTENPIYDQIENLTNPIIYGTTTDKDNNYIIIYGEYDVDKGFIALADNEFNAISLFTTYDGGTNLPAIRYLTYDEDGNFFGVCQNSNGTNQLLMLNNFTLTLTGEYAVKFRQSYNLDGDLQSGQFRIHGSKVFKKIGNAEYIFVTPLAVGNSSINSVIVSKVQINVGSENEWVHTIYPVELYWDLIYNGYNGFETFASWVGDDYYVKFGGMNSSQKYVEYRCENSGTISSRISTFDTGDLHLKGKGGIIMPNYSTTYVATDIRTEDPKMYYIWKVTDTIDIGIYATEDTIPSGVSSYLLFKQNNNTIIFAGNGIEETNGNLGIIINDNVYLIGSASFIYEGTELYITKQYNLNKIYLYSPTYIEMLKLIYNQNDYLGTDYSNTNSMISNSGRIYDENNKIIFARDIYNKIVNQNTTESIIEVPNTYLNDISIAKQELWSETNSILNTNEQQVNKNIYETVYFNFYNTINMSNQNDPNNPIINQAGASRLNGSISGYNNYKNVKIGLIKVNYNDNTNLVIPEFNLTQNSTTNYTISFNIYVPKEITNIQILSEDGNTVYQTITTPLEVGKYYKLTQDVRIV
jgi:hypothetical protein